MTETAVIERVTLSHGAGGPAMTELVRQVFLSAYGDCGETGDDSAILDVDSGRIAFTTDSFIVDPLFFPGGDIGRLSVAGTVNDLLTAAARPVAVAASFIIEEGFQIEPVKTIASSMHETAREAGVRIMTGDTKVVPAGAADKVFITTTGVGVVLRDGVSGSNVSPGDRVIVTGSVGDHGAAVLLARENLLDAPQARSDVAPLTEIVLSLIESDCEIHAMRDPTRGGLAAALNEIARQSGVAIEIDETSVPVTPEVRAVCEALGLDVLQVANEGKMLVFVAHRHWEQALSVVRASRYGTNAQVIGEATSGPAGRVTLRTVIGTSRLLRPPVGELLPRIC